MQLLREVEVKLVQLGDKLEGMGRSKEWVAEQASERSSRSWHTRRIHRAHGRVCPASACV